LVGGGSELLAGVAEFVFDGAEELRVGLIDEGLGHDAEGAFGGGAELLDEGLDAGFTIISGRMSGRGGGR
jgi:hypothetical protein